ncbi:tRNA threonylcarbamoyladenosine dehydratase [Selenomonas sp. oral taxon 126]|uniref:tRNA threonylcarbamoyladenosine dehydratase n=1 Tax=Selenomonas sp. oral taxon 126 TaxID=712528 RepID=UPI0008078A64|nr:tRNA threonylcarbamoyladenosine dehydratase [Selenomonas sp. oral taxon 126]ANR71599.1 tRNA threonylcarbamoyladenosine dehydratase [Selenomonas sp. oral taxon 126]
MNDRRFARTEMLVGSAGVESLAAASVAVFGIGGVGSYAAEALARAGIGKLTLVDHDVIDVTNINRQIHALTETVGMPKTETMARRIRSINPACDVREIRAFYQPADADAFFPEHYDYVLDAVDTVTAKIDLAVQCHQRGIPLIASMGAANKLDPTLYEIMDLYRTKGDPLARILRKKLKEKGVPRLKVVCSRERPRTPKVGEETSAAGRRSVPASISFVPSAAGLMMAGAVVRDLLNIRVEVSS